MIDSKWRKPYQKWLIDPLLKKPAIQRLQPNLLTLFGLIFGLATCPLIANQMPISAFCCLLFTGFMDTLDGSLARVKNQTSSRGTVLDVTSDRCVEFAVILGLFFVDPVARALPSLLMLGSVLLCITTFLVVGIFTPNQSEKSFYYSPGIIERTEAFIFFGWMIFFPSHFLLASSLFSGLVFLTAGWRLYQYLRVS